MLATGGSQFIPKPSLNVGNQVFRENHQDPSSILQFGGKQKRMQLSTISLQEDA